MLKLKVSGMTCGHCVSAVMRAVKRVAAVEDVAVNLEHGDVTIKGNPNERAVREAITDEGYEVQAAA